MNDVRHTVAASAPLVARRTAMTIGCAMMCVLLAACGQRPAAGVAAQASPNAVERGRYLVTIAGCHDCHTPKKMSPEGPQPDTTKLLAGHPEEMRMGRAPALPSDGPWAVVTTPTLTAWSGPWGVSFAANLTPDQNTGLGTWTEDMFVTSMRTGKHMGVSRPILPPMPWQDVAAMSDDDLKAIYAYLRTIPPIVNHVPDPIPPAPASHS